MTFAVFAKNTTGSNPDMSSELAFLAEEDEWEHRCKQQGAEVDSAGHGYI